MTPLGISVLQTHLVSLLVSHSYVHVCIGRTNFLFWTDGRFSNPENSLIQKYWPGINVSGLTNHHCTHILKLMFFSCAYSGSHSYLSALVENHDIVMKNVKVKGNVCVCGVISCNWRKCNCNWSFRDNWGTDRIHAQCLSRGDKTQRLPSILTSKTIAVSLWHHSSVTFVPKKRQSGSYPISVNYLWIWCERSCS